MSYPDEEAVLLWLMTEDVVSEVNFISRSLVMTLRSQAAAAGHPDRDLDVSSCEGQSEDP